MTLTSVNWHPLKGCSADKKPLEIYMFVDPLCPECWALEPIMKKLHIEYGQYFRIRYILSGQLWDRRVDDGAAKGFVIGRTS